MHSYWHKLFDCLQGRGEAAAAPRCCLTPIAGGVAAFYGLGARARRGLYGQGWLQVKRLPGPVVSVGNLTVGGTGKTPVTACLARLFQGQGYQIAILSRGYGGQTQGVTRISDGQQIYARPPDAGDEAFWLALNLPGAAVYTSPERYAAGLAAWRDCKPDLFLLDDGFQHFQLHRDLDVVLLDADAPFGNGHLLPRGPLREPVATLAAAQVLILTRFQAELHQERLKLLQEKFPDKTVLTATISPTRARIFPEDRDLPLEGLKGQSLLAFAGLARPRVFYDTLRDLGVNLLASRDFPDHYAFQPRDLAALVKEAQTLGAGALITSSKDWARLGEKWDFPLPLMVLEVEARLEEGGAQKILAALGEAAGDGHRLEGLGHRPSPALTPPPRPFDGVEAEGVKELARGEGRSDDLPYQSSGALSQNEPLPLEVKQRLQGLGVRGKWRGDPAAVGRVLVRVPNWVGDAVMALPALAGVQTLFPQAEITVLAAPRVAPLFAGQPGVAQVVVYPPGREKWRTLWQLRRTKTRQQLTADRRPKTENRPFDLGLALPNSLEAALGLWLAGASVRVGYNTDARGPLLTVAVSGAKSLAGLHTVYYFLGVLQGLGGVDTFCHPRLYLRDEEVEAAAALLKSDLGEGPWVGLSPGAAYGPAKRWPPERFGALGLELQKEFGARLVLLGGPEDRDTAKQVKAHLPQALDLVGQTGLRQALGVLTKLNLLVTNDSGLMHAAAALGTRLIALFGSTDPVATGPFTRRATVLHHPLPCNPCLKRTCDQGYQCLLDISVEEVLDAAHVWLKEGS